MKIQVEYKKTESGKPENLTYNLTRLAFVKHLAISGQAYAPKMQKLVRAIGMFLHYNKYIQRKEFYVGNRFSEPPFELSDPTEKGQFSNLAGKAIADFLSKKINRSIYTVNYEAAMRINNMKITGKRPDLLAFNKKGMFAIEAKGYSSSGCGDMAQHKEQSKAGNIKVNFSVASVSYDLYNQVKCKYHDPFNDNVPFDNELLKQLTKKYYSGLYSFLNQEYFEINRIKIQDEFFYELKPSGILLDKIFINYFPFYHSFIFDKYFYLEYPKYYEHYNPRLILPINIEKYAEEGITNNFEPFIFENREEDQNIYIDNDRIGLRVKGR